MSDATTTPGHDDSARPDNTPKPEQIDPEEGTDQHGAPVENPSG
ncbi:hypothetical protein [Agreia sp. COWG]|nr:hypothetical protein [Agreia sp. COWG]